MLRWRLARCTRADYSKPRTAPSNRSFRPPARGFGRTVAQVNLHVAIFHYYKTLRYFKQIPSMFAFPTARRWGDSRLAQLEATVSFHVYRSACWMQAALLGRVFQYGNADSGCR